VISTDYTCLFKSNYNIDPSMTNPLNYELNYAFSKLDIRNDRNYTESVI